MAVGVETYSRPCLGPLLKMNKRNAVLLPIDARRSIWWVCWTGGTIPTMAACWNGLQVGFDGQH